MDNGFIIRGTVSMLVRWFCDLNYVGTLVYAEMVSCRYGDLDLHGGLDLHGDLDPHGGRAADLGPKFLRLPPIPPFSIVRHCNAL